MRNHADDLAPLSLRRANAKQDAFAHSRFVWKSLRGKRLVNYQEVSFGRIVVLGKGASGHQGCADGFEIARQHDLKIVLPGYFEAIGTTLVAGRTRSEEHTSELQSLT